MGKKVTYKGPKGGEIIVTRLPTLSERKKIFSEGLELIQMFGAYSELLELAGYRRQVTNVAPVPEIDEPFLQLVRTAFDKGLISTDEIKMILERMPRHEKQVRGYVKKYIKINT